MHAALPHCLEKVNLVTWKFWYLIFQCFTTFYSQLIRFFSGLISNPGDQWPIIGTNIDLQEKCSQSWEYPVIECTNYNLLYNVQFWGIYLLTLACKYKLFSADRLLLVTSDNDVVTTNREMMLHQSSTALYIMCICIL